MCPVLNVTRVTSCLLFTDGRIVDVPFHCYPDIDECAIGTGMCGTNASCVVQMPPVLTLLVATTVPVIMALQEMASIAVSI